MCSNKIDNHQIVAISNPRSGRNKRGGFEKFCKVIACYPQILHVVTSDTSDLVQTLQACKQSACKVLIINGGDGTLLHILTYLKQAENLNFNPSLVLLQAGTTSMAYGDVGCKGKLDQVLAKIIGSYFDNSNQLTKTKRDVISMTLPARPLTICGMFFGGGVIYNGILYCRQNLHTKGLRGEFGPSMAMIRYLLDWLTVNKMTTSTCAKITYDHKQVEEADFTFITATTLKRLLMGVYPYWAQHSDNTPLAFTLIKKNAPQASKAFRRIIFGRSPDVEVEENFYHSVSCTKVTLDIHDGFTLDGELFGQAGCLTRVELESAGEVTFLT